VDLIAVASWKRIFRGALEAVNAGWMELGIEGTEHVAGTRSARDVFAAAQNAAKA
jgi:hypothetical protein